MKKKIIKEIIDKKILVIATSKDKRGWTLLKNGERSPIFLDTAKLASYPKILKKVNELVLEIIKKEKISFDKIIGVPYGGLPFAYGVAALKDFPCIFIRKEGIKKYSTSGEILGFFQKGERVLMIEDATVTARTALYFAEKLRGNGLIVNDVITIVDTGGIAREKLGKKNIKMHNVFSWAELYDHYKKVNANLINEEMISHLNEMLEGFNYLEELVEEI
jgi:uridine monophosphate synthetase